MKLENVRENYQYYSEKTSEIIRQLGFAGIALVWIFKTGNDISQAIPQELFLPTILIVLSLSLDLLHYVVGTLIWGVYNRKKENAKVEQKTEFLAPRQINWATLFLFWSKIMVLIFAYYFIMQYLYHKIFNNLNAP